MTPEELRNKIYIKNHKLKVKHINETLEEVVARRHKEEYLAKLALDRATKTAARLERGYQGKRRKK